MDDERSCDGSTFQTVEAATWKLRRPSCVLVEGTSMPRLFAHCSRVSQTDRQTDFLQN